MAELLLLGNSAGFFSLMIFTVEGVVAVVGNVLFVFGVEFRVVWWGAFDVLECPLGMGVVWGTLGVL